MRFSEGQHSKPVVMNAGKSAIDASWGNWMSNKAKVKPLNLSFRSKEGYPNSISKDMYNPSARLAYETPKLRCDQCYVVSVAVRAIVSMTSPVAWRVAAAISRGKAARHMRRCARHSLAMSWCWSPLRLC